MQPGAQAPQRLNRLLRSGNDNRVETKEKPRERGGQRPQEYLSAQALIHCRPSLDHCCGHVVLLEVESKLQPAFSVTDFTMTPGHPPRVSQALVSGPDAFAPPRRDATFMPDRHRDDPHMRLSQQPT